MLLSLYELLRYVFELFINIESLDDWFLLFMLTYLLYFVLILLELLILESIIELFKFEHPYNPYNWSKSFDSLLT